jgi:hypothetical protein
MRHYMRCQISRKRSTLALTVGKYTAGWGRDVGSNAHKPLPKESLICAQS